MKNIKTPKFLGIKTSEMKNTLDNNTLDKASVNSERVII